MSPRPAVVLQNIPLEGEFTSLPLYWYGHILAHIWESPSAALAGGAACPSRQGQNALGVSYKAGGVAQPNGASPLQIGSL